MVFLSPSRRVVECNLYSATTVSFQIAPSLSVVMPSTLLRRELGMRGAIGSQGLNLLCFALRTGLCSSAANLPTYPPTHLPVTADQSQSDCLNKQTLSVVFGHYVQSD
jgi:hypothetical protein